MMFNGHMRDLHQEKSHENLKQLFSKSTPSRTQFFSWFGEFRRSRRSFEDHWCVTSATAVTIANIEAAEKLIRVEPRITTREIQKSLSIGTAATMSISHDHLRVRKRCARWTPHSLTDEQRRVRVEWSEFMLRKLNGGRPKLTWEVLTGYETWIYRCNPETKMQSAVWLFPDESTPQKLKGSHWHTEKNGCLFLRKIGPCRHHSS